MYAPVIKIGGRRGVLSDDLLKGVCAENALVLSFETAGIGLERVVILVALFVGVLHEAFVVVCGFLNESGRRVNDDVVNDVDLAVFGLPLAGVPRVGHGTPIVVGTDGPGVGVVARLRETGFDVGEAAR